MEALLDRSEQAKVSAVILDEGVSFDTEIMSKARELYEQGRQAETLGRIKDALKLYKSSAREDPSFRPAFNNLGALYARAKRPDLAISFFKRTLELGEDAIVCFNLASEFYQLDQPAESIQYLKRALRHDRRMLKAHILLAYIYEGRKQREKAEVYFNNALKIAPANRPATLGLAVNLSERGLHELALRHVDRYLASRPKDGALLNLRAGLLLQLNRYDESIRELDTLTETAQGYVSFTDHLQKARQETETEYGHFFEDIHDKIGEKTRRLKKNIEKRRELLEKEAPSKDDLKDMVDLSLLHLFNGNAKKAMRFLLQARKMGTKDGNGEQSN